MILIPAMIKFLNLDIKEAKFVSLFAYIPSAVSMIFSGIINRNIEFSSFKKYIFMGILGSFAGCIASKQLNNEILNIFYDVFLIIFGIYLLLKAVKTLKNSRSMLKK